LVDCHALIPALCFGIEARNDMDRWDWNFACFEYLFIFFHRLHPEVSGEPKKSSLQNLFLNIWLAASLPAGTAA